MPAVDIHLFPCLKDNYGVLVHENVSKVTASIDAPAAGAVRAALAEKGWQLTHILATHHHNDHVAGIADLKSETGCKVIGPRAEESRIPGIDVALGDGEIYRLGSLEVQVLDTPGHTVGHVCYWIPEAKIAFTGDTLFAMGCGRVFEGTPEMMWNSLQKIMRLPKDTAIYCGHEYTLANARFGLTIEPSNEKLRARLKAVVELRAKGLPTIPTRLDIELETNVFLRPNVLQIRSNLGLGAAADWRVFAEIRERKNKS